ncbi:LysR family transcriptional regulator [Cribrihabitans pelagius]|uniref:LysR family transcriptional regulator n=1 Tax=Cribrihabitans pelagius TaxID=1765746 RepID=UPI003B590FF3
MKRKELSLQWLEMFQICARKGTLQAVAAETGLSVSTVSHHLRNLEDHLGVALFDHARRPMVLTPAGARFLRNIDEALLAIRKAKTEASGGNLAETRLLRLGLIDDFDSDIAPELAVYLAGALPKCDFRYHTDSSHGVLGLLQTRELDAGLASDPQERFHGLEARPMLRDPFVMVLPAGIGHDPSDILHGRTPLPFLRFSARLMIARQIEAQLQRTGVSLPNRFECANNQTLMAMVASGAGWTITTPLQYARARRFRPRLQVVRFPGRSFARSIVLVASPECAPPVLALVDQKLRELISAHAIQPLLADFPWLRDSFHLED